ncbi:MAG: PIN domain-containing protein [Candidatus Bathyarchaeia archaeon]|jgi:predicted nucleic acid-binding protein
MKAVIDTRFLIAHFLSQDELSKKWTKKTLENLQNEANVGVVPSIVIHEFYKFLLETYGKNIADIRVNIILSSRLETVNLDPVIGIEAAKLRCKYAELPTADAVIAATAVVMSCEYVLTDDKHIKQVKETKTRWI